LSARERFLREHVGELRTFDAHPFLRTKQHRVGDRHPRQLGVGRDRINLGCGFDQQCVRFRIIRNESARLSVQSGRLLSHLQQRRELSIDGGEHLAEAPVERSIEIRSFGA
jgi:hypothetical protein